MYSEGQALTIHDFGGIMGFSLDNVNDMYIDVLREVGACFSVNKMLSAECYKQHSF